MTAQHDGEQGVARNLESNSEIPVPDDALYEVTVWNIETQAAEHGILTTGRALAATVDLAYQRLAEIVGGDEDNEASDVRLVVVCRA